MRICSNCKEKKPLSEYHPRYNRKNETHQSWCKECVRITRTQRVRENRRKGIELLGGECSECGYKKCESALHFHHPDPSLKDDMFHRLRNRKWDYIKQTLLDQKCVLLCANCHYEAHWL